MENENPYDPPQFETPPPDDAFGGPRPSLSGFDRLCAVLAFALGIALLILGLLGIFFGCNAHFTLPPVLGALPALVGWGILKSVYVAWRARRSAPPMQ
jgi:hypothetical protein